MVLSDCKSYNKSKIQCCNFISLKKHLASVVKISRYNHRILCRLGFLLIFTILWLKSINLLQFCYHTIGTYSIQQNIWLALMMKTLYSWCTRVESVFNYSQCKFVYSFFLQIGDKQKPHSGTFLIKTKHNKLNNIYCVFLWNLSHRNHHCKFYISTLANTFANLMTIISM